MGNVVKRIVSLIIIMAIAVPAVFVRADDEYYVSDYAGVLSRETRDSIVLLNTDPAAGLEAMRGGAQIVVVVLDTFSGGAMGEYAAQLFAERGVGSAARENGMLLLIDAGTNRSFLHVGRGLRGEWTAAAETAIFAEYFSFFEDGYRDYDAAVMDTLGRLFEWYMFEYAFDTTESASVNRPEPYADTGSIARTGRTHWATNIFRVIGIVGALLVVFFVLVMAVGGDKFHYSSYYKSMSRAVPKYHFWYSFMPAHKAHRIWWKQHGKAYMNRGNYSFGDKQTGGGSGGEGGKR